MRIACLQHVPFEGPAVIGQWAARRGASLPLIRLFAQEPLPALDAFDMLVILGGPMSVNDEAQFEWLHREKTFVRLSIEAGKRVLGICLGAQLIANALGAKVYPNAEREIGWFPVRRVANPGQASPFDSMPESFPALHWHGETFDLPPGATQLARSEACEHQAFGLGDRVLGLQFHLESTVESVEALIQNCPADLAPGRFIGHASKMCAQIRNFETAHQLMFQLLDSFTQAANGR